MPPRHARNDEAEVPTQGLTIYLIKEEFENPEAIVQVRSDVEIFSLVSGRHHIGDLYVQRRRPQPPRWAKFFRGYLDPSQLGQVASASAVLLIKTRARLFAVTFGQGRHLLNPDAWEERFGLRVALNSIGESNVRSIDKRTFDSISRHSREQASREAAARDFQIDIEQDLLRAITGTPTDSELGRRMSGMDALHAAIPTDLDALGEVLSTYYEKYLDTSYQRNFPWVDHIGEVSSRRVVQELDATLVGRLNTDVTDGIWMAVPDVVTWEDVDGFRWTGRNEPLHNDISLAGFLRSLPGDQGVSERYLRQRKVGAINHDGQEFASWQAYRCIHAQLDHEENSYLLTGGKWYRLTRDFVTEVNNEYRRIPRYAHNFPLYADATETRYNERVANVDPGQYALMDAAKRIQHGGSFGQVEFCDLFVGRRDIVHIKRYGASAVLSHLFSQGLISGELFQVDVEFRRKVNQRLPEAHRIADPIQRPQVNEYQVVFAVISDVPGDLTLPFFSRLNVRHAVRRLTGYGYRVSLAKIDVKENFSRLQRFG